MRQLGIKTPIRTIPNGVTLPDLVRPRPAPPWSKAAGDDRRVMLFLGRLHPKKGLSELLAAWSTLRQQKAPGAEEWRIVVVGWGAAAYESELRAQCARQSRTVDFEFCGPLFGAAKDAALRNADAFILPSFSEGLPMAVLEAWAYGLPVLMTDECNLPQGFQCGAAHRVALADGGLVRDLADFVARSPAQRQSLGSAGRRLVETEFTWERVAAQLHRLYLDLLGSAGPCPRDDEGLLAVEVPQPGFHRIACGAPREAC